MISDFIEKFSFLKEYYPLYIEGAITTIMISFLTVILGSVIGVFLALMKLSKFKIVKTISSAYIEIIRGTPILVQVLICYHGIPTLPDIYIGGLNLAKVIPGALALSLNSGAYVAEIIRAGILAVDKGQTEAAESLGMKKPMFMRYIILPQAIKNILPAIGNEFIVLIKESSILYTIGIQDLMAKTNTVITGTYRPLEPLLVVSFIYFMLTFGLAKVISIFERRLNKDDRN